MSSMICCKRVELSTCWVIVLRRCPGSEFTVGLTYFSETFCGSTRMVVVALYRSGSRSTEENPPAIVPHGIPQGHQLVGSFVICRLVHGFSLGLIRSAAAPDTTQCRR